MLSLAVWAMSGVWLFESSVPLSSMKCSSEGIISMSDGTFGLSRLKCTLSKKISTTWLIPPLRLQVGAPPPPETRLAEADRGTASEAPVTPAEATTAIEARRSGRSQLADSSPDHLHVVPPLSACGSSRPAQGAPRPAPTR